MRNLITLFAVIAALGTASCDQQSNTGVDGYTFESAELRRSQTTINLVTYKTRTELLAAAKNVGIDSPNVVAFATYPADRTINQCTIHVIDPTVAYQPEWIGHETVHCFFGQWHPGNNNR